MSVAFFCRKDILDEAYKKVLSTFESIYEKKKKNSSESDEYKKVSFKLCIQTKRPVHGNQSRTRVKKRDLCMAFVTIHESRSLR